MAQVTLEQVSKSFGDVVAVDNLSLTVRDNELLVMLGPSGCGKTTCLRLITGLEVPDSGNIYIGDTLVNHVPPKDRDVAMVFQSYALFPHKTIFENIAFPLLMRKTAPDQVARATREVAQLLRIEHLLERKPAHLSGGEQQRVAVARAIVRKPKVFLMDEPLSNLDAKLRLYVRAELKALQKELQTTTIYVTHDQIEAMTMADRIALLNQGRLQQLASPMEIYRNPVSRFVAGFMGAPPTNLVECVVTEQDGEAFLTSTDLRVRCGEFSSAIKERATGKEMVIGIRAEEITIEKNGTLPSKDSIKATVYVVEPLGAETIVDVKVGEQLVKVRAPADVVISRGDHVQLRFDHRYMHVFDKATEQLIV